ncbi:MAG: hypothetical protein GX552_09070 [Chloroflexi bacterium]|jgi:hypothetical protein|nr:hypothetical protein [Chloroflexota bacterium]
MTKYISVTWTEGISEQETNVLTHTVDSVLKWLYLRRPSVLHHPPIMVHLFGNWVIPELVSTDVYWGTQWYIDTSYNDALQRVIGPVFLDLTRQEPWQQLDPHFDMALITQDLTDLTVRVAELQPDHYALGTSVPGSTAVMSVHRIRSLADEHVRELALSRLVRHHLGHVLGLPRPTRDHKTTRMGLETHCTNRCVMRHTDTVEELAKLALEESEMGWHFCEQCTRELHSVVARYAFNWS